MAKTARAKAPTAAELKEMKAVMYDEKRNVTARISDTCRFIGFGLLTVFYTIKSGDSDFTKSLMDGASAWVVWAVGVTGAVAILADYLQYWFAKETVQEAIDSGHFNFNRASRAYREWSRCFSIKQAAVLIGAIMLIALVASA